MSSLNVEIENMYNIDVGKMENYKLIFICFDVVEILCLYVIN